MSHGTVCYLYSLHPDFYTLVSIINRDLMGNFCNNGPTILGSSLGVDYNIGNCCFSAKHAALVSKS